jgi:hypothetical protein
MLKLSGTNIPSLAERLAVLNEGEVFLPRAFLQQVVLPYILASYLFLVLIYCSAFPIIGRLLPKGSTVEAVRKACYQFTCFSANLVLAVAGLYMHYFQSSSDLTEEQKTQGHNEFVFMSCFQLGYQFWGIPIGLFYVSESSAMLFHHATVIAVSTMSGFLRNGFRYWTPFFYGVIEISSVPLSIMSFLKDHPELIKKHPVLFSTVRTMFAVSFIYVRIIMFVPRLREYLSHLYLLFSAHPSLLYRMYMSSIWASSFILLVLQVYWATLIISGTIKHYRSRKSKKKL